MYKTKLNKHLEESELQCRRDKTAHTASRIKSKGTELVLEMEHASQQKNVNKSCTFESMEAIYSWKENTLILKHLDDIYIMRSAYK